MARVFLATVLMMVVGGGIAYFGDWLGLKLGKRRLSLFGLRPKSTARALTIVAGALIALLTFAILFGLDKGFAIALQHGAQILERNNQLKKENTSLHRQADAAQAALQKAQNDASVATQQRAQAQVELGQINERLKSAHIAIAQVKQQLSTVQTQFEVAQRSLVSKQQELAQAKATSLALEQKNAETRRVLAVVGPFATQTVKTTQRPLIYNKGAEVGRVKIAARQPVAAIRQQINNFLTQLSAVALERGASRGSNGHAVAVATVVITSPGKGKGTAIIAGEHDNIEALAEQIHDRGGDSVVVIATTLGNDFAGEQVDIRLWPYPNRLVLPAGTPLADVTIDASDQDPDKVLAELQKLLQRARVTAVHAGVIPVAINPGAHDTELGKVPLGDLFRVVAQVQQSKKPVIVTATAASDTYSIGELKLSFTLADQLPTGG